MLNREIPFLRIIIPLCAGIISGRYTCPGNYFFLLCSIIILVFLASGLLIKRNRFYDLSYGLTYSFSIFLLGLFLYTKEKEKISFLKPSQQILAGTVADIPEEKNKTFRIVLKLKEAVEESGNKPVHGSMLIYIKKDTAKMSFLPGDEVLFRCIPEVVTSRGNPCEFNYRFYMENQGIRYSSYITSQEIIGRRRPSRKSLRFNALILREKIIDMFRARGIKEDRIALIAAITLGQKNMLEQDQKQYFMKAGVMHIMAVSGLHVVILSLFIFKVLFFFKGRLNPVRVLITLIFLWFFAFLTGLTPSVLRATLMYTFLQAGKLIKRPVNNINSVLASAFILMINKPSVIFDAGFLLSYSAVIYILSFYRDLYQKLIFKNRFSDLIWQSAALTVIAQIGTLPLTIMLFNRFPTWFILSNIIIVPLSSLVVITGCLVPLTFPVIPVSSIIASALSFLAGLTEKLTEVAASLPLATIDNIGITGIECIFLVLIIYLITNRLLKKNHLPSGYLITALLFLTTAGTIKSICTRRTSELIIYNIPGRNETGIRTGRILNIYSDSGSYSQEISKHAAVMNLKERNIRTGRGNTLVKAGNKTILVTGNAHPGIIRMYRPDYLVLTGRNPVMNPESPDVYIHMKAVIFCSGAITGSERIKLRSAFSADTVHFVKSAGAFTTRL